MPKKLITLKEAAAYLKLSDSVIKEMISCNIFKSVKQGRSVKINKNDIDEWLTNLSDFETEKLSLKRTLCRFQDYFSLKNIILDFDADNKYEAIAEMSKFAKEIKIVRDHRWLYEVVVAREELVSTAVGKGFAFLHPRHMHPTKIKTPSIIYGTCPNGVDFDATDGQPVKYFFMLLLHNDRQHLFSLSFLSQFIQDSEKVNALTSSFSADEVYESLTQYIK